MAQHSHMRPLPDTHPELSVVHGPGFVEYRVEHSRLARDGTGRVLRGTRLWSWPDLVLAALVLALAHPARVLGMAVLAACLLWTRSTQVLYESLRVFPALGIQLETHRGHPCWPSSPTSRTHHFIPLSALEDVVLHEGFQRWNVRFYLAALYRTGGREVRVRVAFENVLPYFPVLHVVYLGVQQTLFPPPDRIVSGDEGP